MIDETIIAYRSPQGRFFHLWGKPHAGREGVWLGEDPQGFDAAPRDLLFTEGARQEGSTYTGTVVKRRELTIEVHVMGDTNFQFRTNNEKWVRALSSTEQGHLCAYTLTTGWRYLRVRLGDMFEGSLIHDTAVHQYQGYMLNLVAEEPYWCGVQDRFTWRNRSGLGRGTLRVRNAGSTPAYPQFLVAGPGRPFIQDGPDGERIDMPLMQSNEVWFIDTHPRRVTLVSSRNVNVWAQMRGKRFRNKYPPGSSSEIEVGFVGGALSSQIMSTITPRYEGYLA